MSKASCKKQHSLTDSKTTLPLNDSDDMFLEDEDEETGGCGRGGVSRHLYLKSTHANGTLDKQAVLRRIHRRKRMNMMKSVINSLFGSKTVAPTTGTSSPNKMIRWVDDPFVAP